MSNNYTSRISVNLSGAETETFRDNYVNAMVVDAMAPNVARPSATMLLTVL